ncbi:MAG: CHAT domain-containing protein [Symplocastrum torsivum CPER-KK1]|jgi:CHAT domain-containing protein|uniref:CHAT domain-containing protein n=1 Tax=Symplocastrum torsivum CPER-KK1 TaxID=450513 RepID=A0A951PNM0_9CYAN|nr:CHAT domain-containing protein [Symplocastrum torsivum CPER-KK1]
MGLLAPLPAPVVGQANPPQSAQHSAELEEANRLLNQQVVQLYSQGEYAAAIPLVERALAIREKVLGKEHPLVDTSLNILANLYWEMGNYSQAEPLYQRSLAIREKVLGKEHLAVAQSLNNLALLYQYMENYSQAEPLYQRSLAIWEKVQGKEHPDVAQSLNNLAEMYRAQGNYSQAEPLYQRSLAIREKVLGKEDPDVAASLNNLAELYRAQGNYSQAEPLYQRSLAIREKVLGKEHPDVATSLNNLALLYWELGNYTQAEPLYQRSLAIREKVLGKEHPAVATSLNNLANLYLAQGNYNQAEPLYQRSLAIREKVLGKEHLAVALSLNNLAELYRAQGNYSQAEPLYQRSLSIFEKVLGKEHPDVATSLNNLALLYWELGNYTQAEPLYQRSLAIREKVLGKEHPAVATSLNNLANLYLAQGNYSQAEPLYQRSLAILEKVLGKEHPLVALSLNNVAVLYRAQGNYSQAEPLHQRSLAIREKVLGKEHSDVASSLNNLAGLYQAQGNYSQAEPLYQRSLAIFEKVLGKEHPDVASSLNNLAGLYWAQGNIARTLEFQTRGTNIEERNLALIFTTGSEARKRDYIATLSGTTNRTVSLHVQDAPNNPEAARLALTTILQRKGIVLDALSDSLQTLRQNLKPEDQKLLNELAASRSQLAALLFKGTGNLPSDQYRQQVASLKAQADQLEGLLSTRSAEFRTESQPVTIEAVQQLIPPDAALVELMLYYPFNPKATKPDEYWGAPRYVAYVLHSTGEPKWVDLGEAAPINQAVADFRKALRFPLSSNVKPVARTLDELLMQPVRKLLGNSRTVLLSPDSQLNLIPFAALVDENNRYLVENYSITYLSSGRDLLRLQNPTQSSSSPVLFANPDYDKPGNPSVPVATTRSTLNQRSTELAQIQVGPLPGTAMEAEAIAPMLPGVTVLTGSQATENALKQLQSPKILHIATHGFFLNNVPLVAPPDFSRSLFQEGAFNQIPPTSGNTENPLLRSGIALAGFNPRQSGSEDGVLTALEAAGLNLSGTELVVLSACETGLGDVANGDGVYGLRRALAVAGTDSQLQSLWIVDDFGTKDLMVSYYKRLMANVERSEALRQTQLEMLQNRQYQHPYYWAAFIPSGDWRAMQ